MRFGSALAIFVGGVLGATTLAGFGTAVLKASPGPSPLAVRDIPAPYLIAYRAASDAFDLGPDGWSYLAAIGKIESDHGRSTAAGVRSGQNSHGCCAGPMQIHNGFGAGAGTWGVYKVDGDHDGRADIYDPDDAVATAAQLPSGERRTGRLARAVFAYNHAGWYVADVIRQAADYRAQAASPASAPDRRSRSQRRLARAGPRIPGRAVRSAHRRRRRATSSGLPAAPDRLLRRRSARARRRAPSRTCHRRRSS